MLERLLLMGGPGTGKSFQIIKVAEYLRELNTKIYVVDVEDKLEAMLGGDKPDNMKLFVAIYWDELKEVHKEIEKTVKPGEWIAVDRIDLSWPAVTRWYTEQMYHKDLADRLMDKKVAMKKDSMFVPMFDKGAWQPINEQYDNFILRLIHKYKCNILLTAGIRAVEEDESKYDMFAHLGVKPRGQKELGHQPHGVFLLHQRSKGKEIEWLITTAKDDIKGREYFKDEPLYDFSMQYLARDWSKKEIREEV